MVKLYTFLNASSSRLGIPKSATIASLCSARRWQLPPARTERQLALQIHLITMVLFDMEDYYECEIDGRLREKYNTRECPYNTTIWRNIAARCHLQQFFTWEDTISQLQTLPRNRDSQRLTLLATQSTIYWIWTEPNTIFHQQVFKPHDSIIASIDKHISNRLQSFRHANPSALSAMMQLWLHHS
ncbi:hypothetical protein N665_0677s0007 [Sinapis alba]|nr:hypothetical protein N665_0677s0007 [Sinapis alba]